MLELNIVGIGTATFVGMLLGALWYSPLLFGNLWMKSVGKTPEEIGNPIGPMIGSVFANLLTAIGIALLFAIAGVGDVYSAISVGVILGALIIFPAMLSDNLFCGWGSRLLWIQSGYRAVSALLMSLVMYYV